MIQLKKGDIYLDTGEKMVIERERLSPFFSADEIPGEVSYPFLLPPSETNLKALGAVELLQLRKEATHDITIYDDGFQISNAKVAIENVETNVNLNNSGTISAYSLSNISVFYQRIKDKRLQDLELGGPRIFAWSGYDKKVSGFWEHVHSTWNYEGSREYCFYPIYNPGYGGYTKGWMNQLKEYNGVREMARDENASALCPAINLVYLLTQIFGEHGYQLRGELLTDSTFSAITIPSFYGVYWANGVYTPPDPYMNDGEKWEAYPLDSITIHLKEHVPPDLLISTFLVELQKFLPVGFEVNDITKTCDIILLSDINPVGAKERYNELGATVKIELEKEQKIFGFGRNADSADSFDIKEDMGKVTEVESWKNIPSVFLPGTTIFIKDIGEYWKLTTLSSYLNLIWQPVSPNTGEYKPEKNSETITSAISTMPLSEQEMFPATTIGIHGYFPACNQEGNWKNKAAKFNKWGVRFLLFSGALPYGRTGDNLPFAYPSNYHINGPDSAPFQKIFDWSLCLINSTGDGLYDKLWKPWLKTFANRERVTAQWRPSLTEYLQFKWKTPFLINNTPYLIEKINDMLPYSRPGEADTESVAITLRRMN